MRGLEKKKGSFAFPGGARCVACTIRYKSRRRALDPTQQVGRQAGSGSGLRIVRFLRNGIVAIVIGRKKKGWRLRGWLAKVWMDWKFDCRGLFFFSFQGHSLRVVFCFFLSFFFLFFLFFFLSFQAPFSPSCFDEITPDTRTHRHIYTQNETFGELVWTEGPNWFWLHCRLCRPITTSAHNIYITTFQGSG